MVKTKASGELEIDPAIRQKYKPSEREEEMLNFIYNDRFPAMRDSKDRQDAKKEWDLGYKNWEAMREPQGEEDWQSNHFVPLTTSVVESALAEVIDQSPQPIIMPRGSEDSPKATVMKHIFDYTWEVSNSDVSLYSIIKDAFICGTGIGQEYFYQDKRLEQDAKGKTKAVTFYEDSFLEPVKLDDFFVDETAREFTGPFAARDCVRRYIMNIDDFKTIFTGKTWNPLDNAQYVVPGGDNSYYEWYKPPEGINHERQVEVLWYWAIKPRDWLCIVANDVMVKMGPNPYKHKELPFAKAIDIKRPHRFYGKGEPALLESIQDEVNTIRRMIIDRNHLDIDKMFFVSSRLNLSDEDTIARPHGVIEVDDVNSAKAIEYGDIPRSVELTLKHLEDDGTIATGINPRAQSLPTAGTATEAAIIKESTLKRIRLKVRMFEKDFLVRIGKLRVSNILQYYPQTKLKRIVGEEASSEYDKQIATFTAKGLIDPGYAKKYESIPITGKELQFDTKGNLKESPNENTTFFELRPEYYTPSSLGFDIKFAAGATLPVSKTLMQSKTLEMYDRLFPMASAGIGFDPIKLGDMLLKLNDFNPSDFHIEKQGPEGGDAEARQTMLIQLAVQENKLMMQKQEIRGTAYSTPAHTQIHIAFTESPTFQNLSKDDPRVKIMANHIVEELTTQEARAGGGTGMPPDQTQENQPMGELGAQTQGMNSPMGPTASMGGNPEMTSILPGKIQGAGQAMMG
jgi:hypothetical protein